MVTTITLLETRVGRTMKLGKLGGIYSIRSKESNVTYSSTMYIFVVLKCVTSNTRLVFYETEGLLQPGVGEFRMPDLTGIIPMYYYYVP